MAVIVGILSLMPFVKISIFDTYKLKSKVELKIKVEKKLVAIVAMPNTSLIILAGPSDVFSRASAIIKELTNKEAYEIVIISPEASLKSIVSFSGVAISAHCNFTEIKSKIDTLIIAGGPANFKPSEEFYNWLRKTSAKVRRVVSVCRGAFILAEAGLLKNKKANTHWLLCDTLQACYPDTEVNSDSLYVKDGNVYTSGGVSSGTDLALALVEEDYGKDIALKVARLLVVFLKRPGNQLQFSEMASVVPESDFKPIQIALKWIASHIKDELTIEQLAEKCSMSPRNFARVFLKETKMTPGKYIEKIRLEAARKQLESTSLSLDTIASKCGLGGPDTLRRLFLRHLKTTPSNYRSSFRTSL